MKREKGDGEKKAPFLNIFHIFFVLFFETVNDWCRTQTSGFMWFILNFPEFSSYSAETIERGGNGR